jgi:hypothetical protein
MSIHNDSESKANDRLGMMDSVPQSPNPNLTRTASPATSTPERTGSPMKGLPFPAKAAIPALAETSTISAKGENGLWDDDDLKDRSSRARRELSVIEESSSMAQRDDEVEEDRPGAPDLSEESEEEEGAAVNDPGEDGDKSEQDSPRDKGAGANDDLQSGEEPVQPDTDTDTVQPVSVVS